MVFYYYHFTTTTTTTTTGHQPLHHSTHTPGVVTALYLASGDGRVSDQETGKQDEIDFEFLGNNPTKVQTNVFMAGDESAELIEIGSDSSKTEHTYAIQWDSNRVQFFIDGRLVRTRWMLRRLKPLKFHLSIWTTSGGWPGVIQWAGETKWESRNLEPATASFQVISMPN